MLEAIELAGLRARIWGPVSWWGPRDTGHHRGHFNEPTTAVIAYGLDKKGGEFHTISEKGCILSGAVGTADVVSSMAAPSLSVGIETTGGVFTKLIARNTVIPPGRVDLLDCRDRSRQSLETSPMQKTNSTGHPAALTRSRPLNTESQDVEEQEGEVEVRREAMSSAGRW
ncbi:hypothetical protein C8F04DRAFT_1317401 [Mycena alexandri]|uniref:Uncharacterized protein n=1 Tax=Mycena alexandri TaxID=1745969 RepID=A0AAD6T5A4_9AGAR|nr:hypothetical protein C8F04DRAFT_1317401 [Mycena alexandri]